MSHIKKILLFIMLCLVLSISYFYTKTSTINTYELEKINIFLNSEINNGFINHYYSNPSEIKISEILYNNLSVGKKVFRGSEEYNYIIQNVYNGNIPMGDLIKFDLLDIKILYFEKSGLDISENKQNLQLESCISYESYLEPYKELQYIYCQNYSDTHFSKVKCISGELSKDNIYSIKYVNEEKTNKYYQVTLKKSGNNYLFISNKEL